MRRLSYRAPHRLEWEQAADPPLPEPLGALVRPLAVATCDLDAGIVQGRAPVPGPFPFGHEGVGEVTAVAQDVTSVQTGDLVSVPFQVSCGRCPRCMAGHTGVCTGNGAPPGSQFYGLGPGGTRWGGFLADTVAVPFADAMLVSLPPGVDPLAVASLSDNLADGWRAVAPALAVQPGGAVLVVGGAGAIGLYAAAAAVALGAERVDYVDRVPVRLTRAERLGVTPVPFEGDAWPERLGPYPITVDSSADPAGLSLALRSTDIEGTCTSTGIYYRPPRVPLLQMYFNGVTLKTGLAHARPVMPDVLAQVVTGRLHPEFVTAAVVPWDEAPAALAELDDKLVLARPELLEPRRWVP